MTGKSPVVSSTSCRSFGYCLTSTLMPMYHCNTKVDAKSGPGVCFTSARCTATGQGPRSRSQKWNVRVYRPDHTCSSSLLISRTSMCGVRPASTEGAAHVQSCSTIVSVRPACTGRQRSLYSCGASGRLPRSRCLLGAHGRTRCSAPPCLRDACDSAAESSLP